MSLRGVARAAALIASITVLARLAGFIRQVVFARTVGPTCVGSVYQTANTVPNILFEVVAGGALASLVVPLLAAAVAAKDRETVADTASALLTWAVVVLTPVSALVAIFARPLVTALLGGSDCAGAVDLGTRMLLVFAPQVVLYGVGIVLAGVLQAHERFAGPALAPLLSSLVVIAAYVVYGVQSGRSGGAGGLGRGAELVLSVGTTAGVVVLSLSLLPWLRHSGVVLRPTLHFPPGAARRARRLAAAGVLVLAAQQVSVAVALRLANDHTPAGTAVVYLLAQTVFLLPWATLAVPLATSAFPRLSAADAAGFAVTTAQVTRAVVVVSAVAGAGLIAAATPIARVLVEGVGQAEDVTALSDGVVAFAPGLLGYGVLALLTRALYARHAARAAAVAASVGWVTATVSDVIFAVSLPEDDRVVALALGNTVGMTVAAVLLVVGIIRQAGVAVMRGVPRSTLVALIAAAVAGLVGRVVADAVSSGGAGAAVGETAVVGLVTMAVAGVVLVALARDELRRLLPRRTADNGRSGPL